MMMSDGLLRVFWPSDISQSTSPGVIVGWRNSELDIFVVTVLEHVEVGPSKVSLVLVNKLMVVFTSLEMLTIRCGLAPSFGAVDTPYLEYSHFAVGMRCTYWARRTLQTFQRPLTPPTCMPQRVRHQRFPKSTVHSKPAFPYKSSCSTGPTPRECSICH